MTWKDLKILVACEYSGTVRDEFIKLGFNAISCDLLPSDSPGPHIQGDILDELNNGYDVLIAFPPCTFLTVAGNAWMSHPDDRHLPYEKRRPNPKYPNRRKDRQKGIEFFLSLATANIKHIAVENPIGIMSTTWRKPDQIIEPFQFGDNAKKSTCLWLDNLPKLTPTKIVDVEYVTLSTGRKFSKWEYEISKNHKERAHLRSKTFKGIAEAMSSQWGQFLKTTYPEK